ncbi:MAG: two-component regulator propeller domain-containing protein, partial [Chitinophagaceae bacterium]
APYGKLPALRDGLFFGHHKGICYSDGQTFINFTIQPDDYRPLPYNWNRPYSLYSALIDQAGILWFGTQSQGVCRYDGKTLTYLVEKDLAGPAVRTLFQDKKGILWFGNNGGGLYRYDGKTLSNITEEKGLGNPEFLKGQLNNKPGSLARVFSIHEDRTGNLWIGTVDAGVWRYDGTTLVNYTTKDGLPGNSIWKIYKDKAGELWFLVNGQGVCTFNGKSFTTHLFQ